MKFYVTKYALTQGIMEVDAPDPSKSNFPSMLCLGPIHCVHGEGSDWHRTREKAVQKSNVMRKKKIEALFKQISKLEQLTFL